MMELVHHSGAQRGFCRLQYNKGKAINSHVPSTGGISSEMQPTDYAGIIWHVHLSLGIEAQELAVLTV